MTKFHIFLATINLILLKSSNYDQFCYGEKCSNALDPSDACAKFFSEVKWAVPTKHSKDTGLVSICQNPKNDQTAYFASLFSTKRRCPIYSANKISLDPNAVKLDRPDGRDLWARYATTLCGAVPNNPIMSELDEDSLNKKCPILQASSDDYKDQNKFARGHLEPRNTNNYGNKARQETTYTLTNACPQYKKFNSGQWNRIECLTRQLILELSPKKGVFVITGVEGDKIENNKPMLLKKRVAVPEKYWKAVCYPGDGKADPAWGFSVEALNVDKTETDMNLIRSKFKALGAFIKGKFPENKLPFSKDCIDASLEKVTDKLKNMVCNKENE